MQSTKSPNPEAPVNFFRLAGRSAGVLYIPKLSKLCVSLNMPGFPCKLLQDIARYCKILQDIARIWRIIATSYSKLQHFDPRAKLGGTASPLQYLLRSRRSGGTYGEAVRSILGSCWCRAVPGEKPPKNNQNQEIEGTKMNQAAKHLCFSVNVIYKQYTVYPQIAIRIIRPGENEFLSRHVS